MFDLNVTTTYPWILCKIETRIHDQGLSGQWLGGCLPSKGFYGNLAGN